MSDSDANSSEYRPRPLPSYGPGSYTHTMSGGDATSSDYYYNPLTSLVPTLTPTLTQCLTVTLIALNIPHCPLPSSGPGSYTHIMSDGDATSSDYYNPFPSLAPTLAPTLTQCLTVTLIALILQLLPLPSSGPSSNTRTMSDRDANGPLFLSVFVTSQSPCTSECAR